MLPPTSGRFLGLDRVRIEIEPPAVSGNIPCPVDACGNTTSETAITYSDPSSRLTIGRQTSPFVTVIVNRDNRNRFSDDETVGWQGNIILERLPKGP